MSDHSNGKFIGLFLLGAALAVGLIISTLIGSRTIERIKLVNETITIKGYAEKSITSDHATWSGNFQVRSADLVEGSNKLEQARQAVLAYLRENGVPDEILRISSVSTSIIYKKDEEARNTNEIEHYQLWQSVTLESSDVDLIDKISRESTDLIKQGIEFDSYSPEYLYTKLEDLKIEMIGAATADARARAKALVENSGGKVGKLRSAQQGVFQITPEYSTEIESYGMYSTSTIRKKIKAVVTIEYSIE